MALEPTGSLPDEARFMTGASKAGKQGVAMKRFFGFVLFSALCWVASPVAGWDFSGKSTLRCLEEIARAGKFNIIADIPDQPAKAFSCPVGSAPEEILDAFAQSSGLDVEMNGGLAIVRTLTATREPTKLALALIAAEERPTEDIIRNLKSFPPSGVEWFSYLPGNQAVLTGQETDLEAAEALIDAGDKPAGFFRFTLEGSPGFLPEGVSTISFTGIEDSPATFSVKSGKEWRSVLVSGSQVGEKKPVGAAKGPSSGLQVKIGVEALSPALRLTASGTPGSQDDPASSGAEESESEGSPAWNGPFRSEILFQRPFLEVLSRLQPASDSTGLSCDSNCTGTISLFLFGPDEEMTDVLFYSAAKAKGLVTRKIGSVWQVGDPGSWSGGWLDFSLFITKRLQHLDAVETGMAVSQIPVPKEIRDRVRLATDPLVNALIFTGTRGSIDRVKDFIEFTDIWPRRMNLVLETTPGLSPGIETFPVFVGNRIVKRSSDGVATSTLELLPVLFSSNGLMGCKYRFSVEKADAAWKLETWTFLPAGKGTALVEVNGSTPFRIEVHGKLVDLVPPKHESGRIVEEDQVPAPASKHPSAKNASPSADAFDRAFDNEF